MTLDNAKRKLSAQTDVLLTRFTPGQRVALNEGHWAWSPDDRCGTVTAVGRFYVHIRTDDGRQLRVMPEGIR